MGNHIWTAHQSQQPLHIPPRQQQLQPFTSLMVGDPAPPLPPPHHFQVVNSNTPLLLQPSPIVSPVSSTGGDQWLGGDPNWRRRPLCDVIMEEENLQLYPDNSKKQRQDMFQCSGQSLLVFTCEANGYFY